MCYSAEVERDWLRYRRVTGADINIHDFYRFFVKRQRGLPFRMPRAIDSWFDSLPGEEATEIRKLISEYNAEFVAKQEKELFTQRARLAAAERALAVKVTKKQENEKRVAGNKAKAALRRIEAMKRTSYEISDGRWWPDWYAPVVVVENGKRVCKPMRWKLRPYGFPPSFDRSHEGCYNARMDSLGSFWKKQFGRKHCLTVARRFFESVDGPNGENVELEFQPNGLDDMLVACIWDRWIGSDGEVLESFAAITTDPPPEVRAAGHDRCIVPIKPEHVEAWLSPDPNNLDALYAILEDRERPYYEHRLAA